jgi:hypothetical protein
MAENESLDLGNPGGQRWSHVHDAVRKGQSAEDVAKVAKRKLPAALRKAFKEFADLGVPFEQFLANRHDNKTLGRLVRKCQGHEYAHLFAETAAMEAAGDDRQVIGSYLDGMVERVNEQIAQDVAGSAHWPSFPKIREFLKEVRQHLGPDMQRIAGKLARDPTWNPTISRGKKGEKANPTKEMLNVSLLGMNRK